MNQLQKRFDKTFFKSLISIALPLTIQNLISSSLNMVDVLMIGSLGDAPLAAVGIGNQFFFLLMLFLFGVNSGGAIFVAQYCGRGDVLSIRKTLSLTLMLGGGISILFSIFAFLLPENIMLIFIEDPEVVSLGASYLRILSMSYLSTAVSFSFAFASRSIGKAALPMKVSVFSLGLNTLLNYLLIFGSFGFPELGIQGAAIATLIARIIEMFILVGVIYWNRLELSTRLKDFRSLDKLFLRRFFKTATPVILNEVFWSLGVTLYTYAYAQLGTEAIAAVQISNTIQNLFMVVAFGLGSASSVMIGNEIGAGRRERAFTYAINFSLISPLIGVLMGSLLFFSAPYLVLFFNVSDTVALYAENILRVLSFVIFAKMFNVTLIIGILRGGGDTTFSLFLEIGSVWFVGVPMAFLGALYFQFPVYYVVALIAIEEIVKALVGIPRVLSKKWIKSVID